MKEMSNARYVITNYIGTLWNSLIGKAQRRFDELFEIIDTQLEYIDDLEDELAAVKSQLVAAKKKPAPGIKKKTSSKGIKVPKDFTGRAD
jgi:hypothetical protein